jgi:hypothetical protein
VRTEEHVDFGGRRHELRKDVPVRLAPVLTMSAIENPKMRSPAIVIPPVQAGDPMYLPIADVLGSAHLRRGFVVLDDPPARYAVRPGWMDPEEEPSGIRLWLVNLGYLDDVGVEDDSVADSISAFQADSGLESTGRMDDATQQKLIDSHGH